jgi:hypothetical protein
MGGGHMRVKSMLTKTPAVMDYDGIRDGLMTPDNGTNRREQGRFTQAKIDMMRRKLNSQD